MLVISGNPVYFQHENRKIRAGSGFFRSGYDSNFILEMGRLPMSGRKYLFTILPAFCLFSAMPAYAGFEWTPPEQTVQEPQIRTAPPVMPMPADAIKAERIDMPAQEQAMPARRMARPPEPAEEAAEMPSYSGLSEQRGGDMPAIDMTAEDEEPLAGFGNDIPLVLAMRQIVPPAYAFSFDRGVDQSMRVNWQGGRPWHAVLEDMLFGAGLGLVISENRIWVRDNSYLDDATQTGRPESGSPDEDSIAAQPPPVRESRQAKTRQPAAEPLDVIMKSHRRAYQEREQEAVPADPKEPAPKAATMMGYDEDIDYQAVSEEHEQSYSPSYPRRAPAMDKVARPQDTQDMKAAAQKAPVDLSERDDSVSGGYGAEMSVPATHTMTDGRQASQAAGRGFSSDLQEKSVAVKKPVAPDFSGAQRTGGRDSRAITLGSSLDPYEIHFWEASKGASLRETLAEWSAQAGVEMFWGAHYDYHLPTSVNMHGSFPDAVKSVLTIYEHAENRPIGRLHPNLPDGPGVLVIENVASSRNAF